MRNKFTRLFMVLNHAPEADVLEVRSGAMKVTISRDEVGEVYITVRDNVTTHTERYILGDWDEDEEPFA